MSAYWTPPQSRHKVFVSYYHRDDQRYCDQFVKKYLHLLTCKSVQPGEISGELSADYIKRLIQKEYLTDASVVVVLIGAKTYCRKHVDWEISAALNRKGGGYSGLLGILLPTYLLNPEGNFSYENVPFRLADNVKSGYCDVYLWNWVCAEDSRIRDAVQVAFDARISRADKIDNSRPPFSKNLGD